MKKGKKAIIILILALSAGIVSSHHTVRAASTTETVCITNETYNNDTLGIGEKSSLTLSKSEKQKAATFTSSEPDIVKVSKKGTITGLAKGDSIITIYDRNSKLLSSYHVCVKEAPKKISVKTKKASIYVGDRIPVEVKLSRHSASHLTYHSSKKSVASVDSNGMVLAKKAGMATITIQTYNKKTAKMNVTIKKKGKLLALTFDDGPVTANTSRLIEALHQYDYHSTFFMVGYQVPGKKKLLRKMVSYGNEIGIHTWDHKDLTKLSAPEITQQIARTKSVIEKTAGITPRLVRPPYGACNASTMNALKSSGYPAVLWNVDIKDWNTANSAQVKQNILHQAHNGAIFVLHDSKPTTVDAVIAALPELNAQGYELVTVSELAKQKKLSLAPGTKVFGK